MNKLYRGDCLSVLRRLPDASVQCCVTSPPYWGLRDYGVAGQLGLEPTPSEYVARMVEVFREVRRVLRPDGTLWLNIGDSYAGSASSGGPSDKQKSNHGSWHNSPRFTPPGLKAKDLVGIPWRLAFALQADGWWLRADCIWHKPNPMPESVRDRPTKAHEYVFLLSKSARYFYDAEAVRELTGSEMSWNEYKKRTAPGATWQSGGVTRGAGANKHDGGHSHPAGRNIRSVWTITPKPFRGAHFATFPPALVERCVKAGTSERGCCPHCGKPWERVTEREFHSLKQVRPNMTGQANMNGWKGTTNGYSHVSTLGFRPACTCPEVNPAPCVVLDPFIGSGTTAAVARSLGRDCIGIDLNPKYLTMARARIKAEQKSADASAGSPAARKVAV